MSEKPTPITAACRWTAFKKAIEEQNEQIRAAASLEFMDVFNTWISTPVGAMSEIPGKLKGKTTHIRWNCSDTELQILDINRCDPPIIEAAKRRASVQGYTATVTLDYNYDRITIKCSYTEEWPVSLRGHTQLSKSSSSD